MKLNLMVADISHTAQGKRVRLWIRGKDNFNVYGYGSNRDNAVRDAIATLEDAIRELSNKVIDRATIDDLME